MSFGFECHFQPNYSFKNNWRAKQALRGEVDGKLYIAGLARMRYVHYVPYVHNPGVHGRFYGLDLKKEMVVLENKPWRSLD